MDEESRRIPNKKIEKWWRRRESNPRPKARPRRTLHACPLLNSHARREEAPKNRRAPAAGNLTGGPRASNHQPARLMASDRKPPGEVRADVTAHLSCESVLTV